MGGLTVWIQLIACSLYVTHQSNSPIDASLITVFNHIATVVIVLPAGVLGDWINRRLLIAVSHIVLGCIGGFFFMTYNTAQFHLPWVLLYVFISGAFDTLTLSAKKALLLTGLDYEQIMASAILSNFRLNLSKCLSPICAGAILYGWGIKGVFLVCAMGHIASGMIYLKIKTKEIQLSQASFWLMLKRGVDLALQSVEFRKACVLLFLFFSLSTGLSVMFPYFAKYYLHKDFVLQGLLATTINVGSLLTVFILPLLKKKFNFQSLLCLNIFISAICFIILSSCRNDYIIVTGILLFGYAWGAMMSMIFGYLDGLFPNRKLARIGSIYGLIFSLALITGSIVVGLLSKSLSVPGTFIVFSSLLLLVLLHYIRHPFS